jgi:hypothetical protein
MWFFELSNRGLRSGLPITTRSAPQVRAQVEPCRMLVLPLGRSLRKHLVLPSGSDHWQLSQGDIQETRDGLVLVDQPDEKASSDSRAMLLVTSYCDPETDDIAYRKMYGWPFPFHIHDRLFLFKRKAGVRIDMRLSHRQQRFTLTWDGVSMNCAQRELN